MQQEGRQGRQSHPLAQGKREGDEMEHAEGDLKSSETSAMDVKKWGNPSHLLYYVEASKSIPPRRKSVHHI